MISIETFQKARAIFVERGGSVGKLEDGDGRVCALGALMVAMFGSAQIPSQALFDRYHVNDFDKHEWMLSDTGLKLYGHQFISEVNDRLGVDAVLHCYDDLIKELER